ncbi:prolyl endopeptidase [Enterobacter cloacae]|nr:prolyl endopeptidase [Enterobacter cloacae]
MFPHLRIARPVTDLARSFHMYASGLGLQKIADFDDHDGFSGIMLGRAGLHWHMELTLCLHHPVQPSPTAEDLLVMYYPEKQAWEEACEKMSAAGFRAVSAFNPYWDKQGATFVDPDGYRVVIQNRAWESPK